MSFDNVLSYYNFIVNLVENEGFYDDSLRNGQLETFDTKKQFLVLYRNEVCLVQEGIINTMRPFYVDTRDNVVRQSSEIIGYLNLEKVSLNETIQNTKMVKLIK